MEERIFLNEGGVKVTNARVLVGSQTYAMSGVTSVRHAVQPAKRGFSVGCFLFAAAVLIFGHGSPGSILFGLILAGVGVLAWMGVKDKHIVILHSSSGESRAVIHPDRTFINRIIAAINNAIVARS